MTGSFRSGWVYRNARAAVILDARRRGLPCGVCLAPLGQGPLEADHVLRVRDGGTDDPRNLRAVHRSCNRMREGQPELPRSLPTRRGTR